MRLKELAHQLRRGERSVLEVVDEHLARIDARDATVKAWIAIDPDGVREAARKLDARPLDARTGALFGTPIGVKDVFDTADLPTGYGSPIYADHRPRVDAACVAALRVADGLVLGKTATTEFAARHACATVNPLDPRRTPGGSSSGSAAAVADAMVGAALGTQTAGSVIRPAAYCGVVGFKPTFNTTNRAGMKPLSESTDTIGVLAGSVEDAAYVMGAIARRPEWLDLTPMDKLRVAVCRTPFWEQADDDARAALDGAAAKLAGAGAAVALEALPEEELRLGRAADAILSRDAAAAMQGELLAAGDLLSQEMIDLIERGRRVAADTYDQSQQMAARYRETVETELFTRYDAILALSAAGEAPLGLQSTGSPAFNHLWTLLHMPCVNLPGMRGRSGLPIGVQLIGPRWGDLTLLRAALWAEPVIAAP